MCGIYGIINTKPRKFDYSTFCTLGIANDARGGDSCGIFIDGEVEYGVGTEKYFQVHFTESPLLKNTKKAHIVLGHDRKASVGGVSEATAQPVVIRDKTGAVRFVMIHNGTIYNYEELAKKYIPNVDIKGMTDSQVLARIFYYKGYECLSEYYGGAAFVAVDYRQPQPLIVMWRGASKKTKWMKDPEEERPLWFVYNKTKGELVFSSIPVYLEALRPGEKVYHPVANALVKYNLDDGEVYIHSQYSRDEVYQTRKETVTTYGGGDYGQQSTLFPKTTTNIYGTGTSYNNTSYTNKYLEEDIKENTYRVRYSKEALHGRQRITKYGKLYGEKEKSEYAVYEVYFFAGVALRNKKYYKFLEYMRKRAKLTAKEFLEKYPNMVRFFSVDQIFSKNGKLVKATKVDRYEIYTGPYQHLGQVWVYDVKDGEIVKESDGRDKRVSGEYETSFKALNQTDGVVISKIQNVCKSLMK